MTSSPDRDQQQKQEASSVRSVPEARQITRARVRDLGALLLKYGRRHIPRTPPTETEPATHGPPAVSISFNRLLWLLRLIPTFLLLLFGTSFVWDFDGMSFTVFGRVMVLEGLLRIVSVSGLIGFLTNWIAITMLFQPRERRPLLGQGLIPAQRERVIFRLAQAVSDELINEEIIKEKIQESGVIAKYRETALSVVKGVIEDSEFRLDVKDLVVDYSSRVLNAKEVRLRIAQIVADRLEKQAGAGLGGLALKAYRFFREDEFQDRLDTMILELPKTLDRLLDETDHLVDRIPEKIEARAGDLEKWATTTVLNFVEQMNIRDMILENMRQYDERRLEELIKNSSNEQLNYIKYLGGVLGFFGGLVIWQPMPAVVVFGTLGAALFSLDRLIGSVQRSRS